MSCIDPPHARATKKAALRQAAIMTAVFLESMLFNIAHATFVST